MNDLQARLVEMMDWFHLFCKKHGIQYYAVGGTVLGAIRHQGFIPWDDDIDIGIPREDYNRLIELFSNISSEGTPYLLETPSCKDHPYPFSKLYDTRTTLIENMQNPLKKGVYLDIFPLDGVGNTEKEIKKQYQKVRKAMMLLHTKTQPLKKSDGLAKKAFYTFVKVFPFFFPSPKKSISNITRICETKSFYNQNYVGNLVGSWKEKEIMQQEWFGQPTLAKFENIQIYLPQDPHSYLTHLYGDYMKLPPVEKQQSHHNYLLLDLDKSYLED